MATAVLRKWVATEKWPPSIAEIRAAASDMINGPAPSWGDGWKEVRNAFAHCGTHEIEKVKKLVSPATFQAIQRIGWWDMCMSENPEALRAQFRQVYEVIVQREQQDKLIAPSTRELISGIVGSMPQLEEGRK